MNHREQKVLTISRTIVVLTLLATSFAKPARAELSSDYYRALQAAATEQWQIEVERTIVTRKKLDDKMECHVLAYCRVINVDRSGCGLIGAGFRVIIEYETEVRNIPIAGPSPIPVLSVANQYRAFVNPNCQTHTFEPAARGRSFLLIER